MTSLTVRKTIGAPIGLVFDTVSDINNFSQAVPHIVRAEILSEVEKGVGTRFRETRLMRGKEATTELEVTEYEPNDRVRIVADSHGTVWDSLFTVREVDGGTELEMTMEARAHSFVARMMNPLVIKTIAGAVEGDMDCVKEYCERTARDAG